MKTIDETRKQTEINKKETAKVQSFYKQHFYE